MRHPFSSKTVLTKQGSSNSALDTGHGALPHGLEVGACGCDVWKAPAVGIESSYIVAPELGQVGVLWQQLVRRVHRTSSRNCSDKFLGAALCRTDGGHAAWLWKADQSGGTRAPTRGGGERRNNEKQWKTRRRRDGGGHGDLALHMHEMLCNPETP